MKEVTYPDCENGGENKEFKSEKDIQLKWERFLTYPDCENGGENEKTRWPRFKRFHNCLKSLFCIKDATIFVKKSKLKCVRIACWFCIGRTLSSKKKIYWPVTVFSCQKGDRACSCLQLSIVKNCGLWKRKIARLEHIWATNHNQTFSVTNVQIDTKIWEKYGNLPSVHCDCKKSEDAARDVFH